MIFIVEEVISHRFCALQCIDIERRNFTITAKILARSLADFIVNNKRTDT